MDIVFGFIGVVLFLIGWAKILIEAFGDDVLWGVGCLIFAPVMPIFVILNWETTKTSFLVSVAGVGFLLLATFI